MQKIKNILSNNSDDVSSSERRSSDVSPRNSLTGNAPAGHNSIGGYETSNTAGSANATSGDTTSMSRNWALGSAGNSGEGNTTSGGSGLTGNTGSGLPGSGTGANVHSGSTGVGSNIGRDTSEISGGRGLGNAATAAGSTGGLAGDHATTGTGSHGSGIASKITGNHTLGHDSRADSKFDPTGENTHHDHKHLQHVTHATHRHMEVEEVERQRDHQRHVHHLQHHVQPVLDTQVHDEVHHHQNHPVTNIQERHVNTDEDVRLFNSLGEKHRDQETHLPKERTVVDLGEKVNTTTHHHVHHVTQPVVQQEVHDRHRIHTTIPLTHTVHEAPIIHKSSMHEPVHISDFMKGGGKLDSGVKHNESGLLAQGDCDRQVDGLGEKLISDLNLKQSNFGSSGTTTGSGLTGRNETGSGLTGNRSASSGLTGGNNVDNTSGRVNAGNSEGLLSSHTGRSTTDRV